MVSLSRVTRYIKYSICMFDTFHKCALHKAVKLNDFQRANLRRLTRELAAAKLFDWIRRRLARPKSLPARLRKFYSHVRSGLYN